MSPRTRPAIVSAAAVLAASILVALSYDLGAMSRHMLVHIATMNIAAPLLAALAIRHAPTLSVRASWLWAATFSQIIILWAWHAPAIFATLAGSHILQVAMHAALFLSACAFWFLLLNLAPASRWHAIPALLATGKLACLLAALLVFAPRTLYAAGAHLTHAMTAPPGLPPLDDQHLAGLLMIVACPLSYLIAAVVIAVELIGRQDGPAALPRRPYPMSR